MTFFYTARKKPPYSARRASMGLALAAFHTWRVTVASATVSAAAPTSTYIHQATSIRAA